jgi:tRNA A-37 threonylcarbamoyl transferase component Bud32
MKYIENDIVNVYYTGGEAVNSSITKLCCLIKDYPLIFTPFKGDDEKAKSVITEKLGITAFQITKQNTDNSSVCNGYWHPVFSERTPIFSIEDFYLYPTVKKTTLFYDRKTDCFFKILQPLTFKDNIFSLFMNKARSIYNLSEELLSKGIKVPQVIAYGMLKKGRKAFFVMKRVEGNSLDNILIKKKRPLSYEIYLKVIEKLAKLHSLGYWHGDLRISHIFIKYPEISGIVDIDSIKKNVPFKFRNLAKDLAGLNNPEVPLTKNEKKALFNYYIIKLNIKNERNFLHLVRHYTERRWKS